MVVAEPTQFQHKESQANHRKRERIGERVLLPGQVVEFEEAQGVKTVNGIHKRQASIPQ